MKQTRDRGQINKWSFLKDMIHGADVVVEIVDARDIKGTRLPIAEKWAGSKRLLMVVNKIDLLPQGIQLSKLPNKGVYVSARKADEDDRWMLIRAILARTGSRPAKAILIGYPNVGKSSVINMLARRKATRVSPVAGTTKNIQWVRISDELIVSDYRGLFPSKEPKDELVKKGAINVQGDEERYAYKFAEKILRTQKLLKWLEKRYDVNLSAARTSEDILTAIAFRRKWYLKGGEPNLAEVARSLIRAMKEAPEF